MHSNKGSGARVMRALAGVAACAALCRAAPAAADTAGFAGTPDGKTLIPLPLSFSAIGPTFTTFTSYGGAGSAFSTGSFYVGSSGSYTFTLTNLGAGQGFYILTGAFSPSATKPATPLSSFLYGVQDATRVSASVDLVAGRQYSFLLVFVGNPAFGFTVTGPGGVNLGGAAALNGNALALGQWNTLAGGFDRLGARLDALRFAEAGAAPPPAQASGDALTGMAASGAAPVHGAWMQAVGSELSQDTNAAGGAYSGHARGVAGGYDYALTPATTVGAAFGYTTTRYGFRDQFEGQSARVDDYQLALYASHDYGAAYTEAMLGYARQNYGVARNFGGTNGNFSGDTLAARLGGGVPLRVTGSTTLVPQARLTYGYLRQNAYTESGLAPLAVQANHAERLRATLGAQLNYVANVGALRMQPFARAFWNHEFKREGLVTGASFATPGSDFTATGAALPRHTYSAGIGAGFLISARLSAVASYDHEAGGGYKSDTARLAARWVF